MLENYTRTKRLKWTSEAEDAFLDVKRAIDECPRLWFMDDTSPIFLATDASNYGMGAYLYQIRDGKEVPIMFLSKTFEPRMRSWHTAHKEGYAIFYALKKLEYLLRDRSFTLKTDHANLRFLKANYSNEDKVQRWLACYQGFDMKIDYLEGPKNVVADSLSRLCPKDEQEQERIFALEATQDLYVPTDKWNIIKSVHGPTTGHHGTERTVQKLRSAGHYWDSMRAHVIKFRRCCPCCQKMAMLKGPIHARKFTVSSSCPMENLAIDFIERLVVDEYGNKYILVIIDSFSRFIELYPTKTNTAVEVAKRLLEHCGRYGKPASIKTDKGAAFGNKVINELCIMLGVVHERTMAYSKEENAIVERANKEILRHLKNIIFDKNVLKKWSEYLPLVQRIMNSCEHRVTGVSPAEIVFGNAINLDNGIILDRHPNTDKSQRLSRWMADMLTVQQKIVHIAQQNLDKHHTVHMNTQPNELTEFQRSNAGS
jgi:transposase InsO family protein